MEDITDSEKVRQQSTRTRMLPIHALTAFLHRVLLFSADPAPLSFRALPPQYAFQEDFVKKRVRDIIEHHLAPHDYNEDTLPHWIDQITTDTLEELHSHKKPYKYIVTCNIMQRTGAALHSAKSAWWDGVSDGSCTVLWPKRNAATTEAGVGSKTIICMVTVFAVAFYVN